MSKNFGVRLSLTMQNLYENNLIWHKKSFLSNQVSDYDLYAI